MNCKDEREAAGATSAFESALRLWGDLAPCKSLERDGVLLVSTGTAIADQNYALRTGPGDVKKMISSARSFFAAEAMPFSWWIPPGENAAEESAEVAEAGLPAMCSPPAMLLSLDTESREIAGPPGGEFVICKTASEADEWAAASLRGFGSGPEHTEPFSAFARAMAAGPSRDKFRLITLRVRGAAAAGAMLIIPGDMAGLFYFSVVPAFRRRSLGSFLLDFTLEEARRAGCSSLALQASPMGAPLYRGAGFADCGAFTVHASDRDAL